MGGRLLGGRLPGGGRAVHQTDDRSRGGQRLDGGLVDPAVALWMWIDSDPERTNVNGTIVSPPRTTQIALLISARTALVDHGVALWVWIDGDPELTEIRWAIVLSSLCSMGIP
ncbi:hypothetical protein KIN20_002956 [Parelaphostrongylus tenuis]|uniref:Uncharacterized protein n=1 Tax=Parelaphostrongylus tenuis TaxID=148309 RepID=A0AAD5M0J7_PARTN|nr:hypothetical protein KIN20_002956 [Parelaphostrongylus tenuis]